MRQGFAGDLEEAMRRAFYDEFQSDIPIKHEVIVERVALFEDDGTPRTNVPLLDTSSPSFRMINLVKGLRFSKSNSA